MKLQNIKGMLELQYGVIGAELVHENDGIKYFIGTDANFGDKLEVKVLSPDGKLHSVFSRFHIEGVDIDVTIEGVSDKYEYIGHLMAPVKAAIIA